MIKNRLSPLKPLLAALGLACLSLPHALGYRGKFSASVAPLGIVDTAILFAVVFVVAFPICYALRILGVHMGWMGGKEADTTRGKKGMK